MFTEVIHICNLHTATFTVTFVIYTSLIHRNHYILCNVQICCIRFSYVDFYIYYYAYYQWIIYFILNI